jgi:NitT/TauT family transport system ATP-binding protein
MADTLQRPLLEISHLKMVFKSASRTVEAIGDVSLTITQGELVCIVGPSGAGKTTLLKCIAGLLSPTSGAVFLEGRLVTDPPPAMALVFQEYSRSLLPWMSVRHNVELPLKSKSVPQAKRSELVEKTLASVGLADVRDAYPWQLSGGMQQRVAIARAIAYEPRILVMDEPFAAIDAQTRADLEDLLRDLWRKLQLTVLFVTHDIDEAVYLGSRVIAISASPTVVMDDVVIDLPDLRTQAETRSDAHFAELRKHVYAQVQKAKSGWRPAP